MFHGVKTNFLMPILTEAYASTRIVNAILQEEPVTFIPWIGWVLLYFKTLLPVCVSDWACDLTGTNNAMDEFDGKRRV